MANPLAIFRAARGVVRLTKDPTRLEEVFRLAAAIESPDIAERIAAEFRRDPIHAEAMDARPRLGAIDLARLRALPEGTLGRTFGDFMEKMGLDPEDLEKIEKVESDFDFVRAHLRETHDVWHTATGFGVDVAGELGLQAFYLAQFRSPLASLLLMVGFANTLFFSMDDRDARMRAIVRGWLLGKRARTLFGVRWAEQWARPLADVRRELGIEADAVDALIDDFIAKRGQPARGLDTASVRALAAA